MIGQTAWMLRHLPGRRFGRLTVLERRSGKWLCVCDCGATTEVGTHSLTHGVTRSCGCLHREGRHGHARPGKWTPEYRSFNAAKQRCNDPKQSRYADYGGRGIRFLFPSFESFLAELGPRPAGMTLDRIDVNGNYEAGNVRWATPLEQAHNRRKYRTKAA